MNFAERLRSAIDAQTDHAFRHILLNLRTLYLAEHPAGIPSASGVLASPTALWIYSAVGE